MKREFVRKYNICGRQKSKYCPHHFTRVFEKFKIRSIAPALYPGSQISEATPQAKQLISREIQENPTSTIRQIAGQLDFCNATIRRILREELIVKPFKFHRCQELRENRKQQRRVFCNWICNRNIDPQKITFADEKRFVLRLHSNCQILDTGVSQIHISTDDSVKQGAEKIMCWVAIVDGLVLRPGWFEKGEFVNEQRYLDLLQQSLWPEVRHIATRREYWYQQDCVPCHRSNECLNFLHEKFPDRSISHRTGLLTALTSAHWTTGSGVQWIG